MASQLTEAMIVNGVVLATVLASDLGPARKIGWVRILRPLIAAGVIVPLFVDRPATHGTSLAVEIAGILAGLVAGLAAAALMRVDRHPATGAAVSGAGAGYAALWIVVIGARAAFSYGSVHWFNRQLVTWAVANHVTVAAITDGLISMAVVMVITRSLALGLRAARIAPGEVRVRPTATSST